MKIGIDAVDIEDLEKKINESGNFLAQILTEEELKNNSLEHLAGKIAAKEAIVKTGFIRAGEWLDIKILSSESGEPRVYAKEGKRIENLEISISHIKSIAVAVAIKY